ncbi:hypothetical protein Bbelb_001900 [Branchiostoma belcheri]|nr:hypothetical protein Bbelb_001900 [Branchiostoma belcheri]
MTYCHVRVQYLVAERQLENTSQRTLEPHSCELMRPQPSHVVCGSTPGTELELTEAVITSGHQTSKTAAISPWEAVRNIKATIDPRADEQQARFVTRRRHERSERQGFMHKAGLGWAVNLGRNLCGNENGIQYKASRLLAVSLH